MKEYIERAALKRELAPYEENDFSQQINVILAIVDAQPAADVAPVVHGKWVFDHMTSDTAFYAHCKTCGKKLHFRSIKEHDKFCKECGAMMDKEPEAPHG